MACDWEAFIKKMKNKCKASTYSPENPDINWKERGSAGIKQSEFLLIKQLNWFARVSFEVVLKI